MKLKLAFALLGLLAVAALGQQAYKIYVYDSSTQQPAHVGIGSGLTVAQGVLDTVKVYEVIERVPINPLSTSQPTVIKHVLKFLPVPGTMLTLAVKRVGFWGDASHLEQSGKDLELTIPAHAEQWGVNDHVEIFYRTLEKP